jgi:hypothetical protein
MRHSEPVPNFNRPTEAFSAISLGQHIPEQIYVGGAVFAGDWGAAAGFSNSFIAFTPVL